MKKAIAILLCAVFLFSFVSCTGNQGDKSELTSSGDTVLQGDTVAENREKTLVVYFSATGTTKSIAAKIAELSKSDLFEIVPKDTYSSQDLDYNSDCRANREQNDDSARPEISNKVEKFDEYDVIYVGYPIWWGKLPKIIYTFLESYDFSGKTVIPFCTSGSSGIEKSADEIKSLLSSSKVKDGKRFSSTSSDEEIIRFIAQK